MDFDRKTILAFLLIGIILILTQTDLYKRLFLGQPERPTQGTYEEPERSVERAETPPPATPGRASEKEQRREEQPEEETLAGLPATELKGDTVRVVTDLYVAEFSTVGASVISWQLNAYDGPDGEAVAIVRDGAPADLGILLPAGRDTNDTSESVFQVNRDGLTLSTDRTTGTLTFRLDLGDDRDLIKRYTFDNDSYFVDMEIDFEGMRRYVSGFSYLITWRSGLESTEPDFKEDMDRSQAYAFQGGTESFSADDDFDPSEWDNPTDWVALRTKYFALSLIPEEKARSVHFYGEEVEVGKEVPYRKYGFDLEMPYASGDDKTSRITLFVGPLDYDTVASLDVGLEKIMDLGPKIIRPFGKVVLWSFTAIHKVIPNYGWVIIVFSILIKILLYPLTRKSYQSMKQMQALQPVIQDLNEKYKDEPQKKQQEMMKIYRDYGVNPLGGCIPMLLQMPLLFALFNVFRSTIELRGEPFILWMQDLSRPDTIATLPFSIPLYGDTVNILPLFMGVTMFFQQKLSVTDPKQKAMVYFMPAFLTLLFNSFPSGLNLYYALFNVLSIAQEKIVPYKILSPEEMKSKAQAKAKTKKRRAKYDYRRR